MELKGFGVGRSRNGASGIANKRASKGFTLMELLGAIAIMVILFAIAVPGVFAMQRNLRMMQLDAEAQNIYNAAQTRLTSISASGGTDSLQFAIGTTKLDAAPADYPDSDIDWSKYALYVVDSSDVVDGSASNNAIEKYLVTSESTPLTKAMHSGEYIVELSPSTGEVYGVYYWESDAGTGITYDSIKDLRTRDQRSSSLVGYYGGHALSEAHVNDDAVNFDDLEFTLVNSEELYAKVVSQGFGKAAFDPNKLSITITVTGTSESWTQPQSTYSCTYSGKDLSINATTGEIDVILDSMRTDPNHSDSTMSFSNILDWYFTRTAGNSTIARGTDVQVAVSVTYDGVTFDNTNCTGGEGRNGLTTQSTNNSFASMTTGTETTANVSCVRHLNNLRTSNYNLVWGKNAFTTVNVAGNIDFDGTTWADDSVSLQSRTARQTDTAANINPLAYFTPITAPTCFDDRGTGLFEASKDATTDNYYEIRDFVIGNPASPVENTGLFATGKFDAKNIHIVNPVVTGTTNTGALFGEYKNSGSITDCYVTTTKTTNTGLDFGSSYVSGGYYVGGLVGRALNNPTITGCHASVNVAGTQYCGGIIGVMIGTLDGCYVGYDSDTPGSLGIPTVSSTYNYCGGVVGAYAGSKLNDSHAMANVSGISSVGGLVGTVANAGSPVSNCSFDSYYDATTSTLYPSTVTGTNGSYVGGLIGYYSGNGVSSSYATGNVTTGAASNSSYYVGGFAGYIQNGDISDCYSRGVPDATDHDGNGYGDGICWVTTDGAFAGGFAGQIAAATSVTRCYSDMNVSTVSDTAAYDAGGFGGFAGLIGDYSWTTYTDCYSSGDVRSNGYVGGFAGQVTRGAQFQDCYSTSDVWSSSYAGGFVGSSDCYVDISGLVASYGRVLDLDGNVPTANTFGGFIGYASNSTWANAAYLQQIGYNDALTASRQPTAYTYSAFTDGVSNTVDVSHPYQESLKGTAFPFSRVGGLDHYGDWPEKVQTAHVTWAYYNGTTRYELASTDVVYGTTPSYAGSDPSFTSTTAPYVRYRFTGWSPAEAPVYADTEYIAQFTAEPVPSSFYSIVKAMNGNTTLGKAFASQMTKIAGNKYRLNGDLIVSSEDGSNLSAAINSALASQGSEWSNVSWKIVVKSGTILTHATAGNAAWPVEGSLTAGQFVVYVSDDINQSSPAQWIYSSRWDAINYNSSAATADYGVVQVTGWTLGSNTYYDINQSTFTEFTDSNYKQLYALLGIGV